MSRWLDDFYPPNTPERIEFDRHYEQYKAQQARLDKIFGWMKMIPPYFPHDYDEQGYDYNQHKGLGPLMYVFWRTLADEGFYGTLDMLAFHYFNDKYVLTFKDIRTNRNEARAYRKDNKDATI